MNKSTIEENFYKHYSKCDLANLDYKVENFGPIEKTTISFKEGLRCPIYCVCDDHYMMWYGDHGSFSFDCTWETSIFNIPFYSPYYLFEKMDVTSIDGSAGKDFEPDDCKKKVFQYIYESDWYEELSDYDKSRVKGYLTTDKWHPDIEDYHLSSNVDKDLVEQMRSLMVSTHDRFEYINTLRELDCDKGPFCDCFELYNAGEILSPHFWLILLCLSIAVEKEKNKNEANNKLEETK